MKKLIAITILAIIATNYPLAADDTLKATPSKIDQSANKTSTSQQTSQNPSTSQNGQAAPAPAMFTAFLVALGTALGATVGAGIQEFYKRRLETSFDSPPRIPKGDRRNSIMMLGLSRSGKTTLIRRIFNEPSANPNERTREFEIYSTMIAKTEPQTG